MVQNSTTPPGAAPWSRERLSGLPRRRLHEGRNSTKATIDLVEAAPRPIVIKDLASRSWPVRRLLGPWQLDREERAYRRLDGVRGIPRLVARPDRQSLVIEYVPGRSLAGLRRGDLDGAFFDRLERLVIEVHLRGIAHGDLHHRDILRGPDGDPYIVDFATSVVCAAGSGPLRRLVFDQMRRADLRTVAALRRRLTVEPAGDLPPAPFLYRLGALLRRFLRPSPRRPSPPGH